MAKYNRDYTTTLPLLKEKAVEYSEGTWNKYSGDIGETLIKFLACTSHTVDYYFRKYLDNLLLPNDDWTAKSLIWELTGYKPPYVRADYMMVQLYWPNCGLLSYVPLYMYSAFTVVADENVYTFLCAEDYLIPPMTTKVNIKLVQGKLEHISQDYTKIENNKIKLSNESIDYDLVTLMISGKKWTQVRNVFYSPETERIFSLHRDADGIYLYLHETWQNYLDSFDTSIEIYFILSDQSFSDETEECISISFAEELLDTNGVDVSQFYHVFPMPNSDTGEETQPSTIEGDRVITVDDYTNKCVLYPGVATAKAFDWSDFSIVREPFKVAIVASGANGYLRGRTKEALISYLKSIGSKMIDVSIMDPIYVKQDLSVLVDIGDYKGTLIEVQLRLLIKDALKEYYKIGNFQPGYNMTLKELNSLILHVDPRISYVSTSFINKFTKGPSVIPILGNLIIITEASSLPQYDKGMVTEHIQVATLIRYHEEFEVNDHAAVYLAYIKAKDAIVLNNKAILDKYPLMIKDSEAFEDNLFFLRKEFLNIDTNSFVDGIIVLEENTQEFEPDLTELSIDNGIITVSVEEE